MAAVSMAVEDARFLKRNFLYFRPELSNSYPTRNMTSQRLPRQPLRILEVQYPTGGAAHSHANGPSVEYVRPYHPTSNSAILHTRLHMDT